MRGIRFIAALLLALQAGAATTAPVTTQPFGPTAAFQGGGPLLGVAEPIPPPPMRVRWTYKTDEQQRAGIEGAPVIVGQSAYVADGAGTLHAIDLATGKARWKYTINDGFATTPLVLDGKIFLGDLAGVFHAVSAADGKKLWTFDSESSIHASANSAGSSVLFANDGADLICLNAADGKVIWQQKGGDRVNSAPSLAGGLAYFSGCDAQLRAIEVANGTPRFAAELGALAPGSAVVAGDRVVVGTDQGHVVCFSRDGQKQLWVYSGVGNEAMVYATPAVADGIVVVGARDRQVHAIDLETGKGKWTFRTRGDVDASALISAGRVYVPSKDKKLYVLDLKTGKSLWEFPAARGIEAGCAIGSGVLIFGDSGGTVFCLEPAN